MTHSCCSSRPVWFATMGDSLFRHSLHSWFRSCKPCRPWLLRERCCPEDRKQLERSPAVKAVGGQRIGWEKKGISSYGAWTFIRGVQHLSVCPTHEYVVDEGSTSSLWFGGGPRILWTSFLCDQISLTPSGGVGGTLKRSRNHFVF